MNKMNKKGVLAISQIMILIISIIAFSLALGGGVKLVSAEETSWTYEKAITYIDDNAKSSDSYELHITFIEEIYDAELLTEDQYNSLTSTPWVWRKAMSYVRKILVENQEKNDSLYNTLGYLLLGTSIVSDNYYRPWKLSSTLEFFYSDERIITMDLEDKYKDHKDFIYELYEDEVINLDQYDDIRGKGWGNPPKNMQYVLNLLSDKQLKLEEAEKALQQELEEEEKASAKLLGTLLLPHSDALNDKALKDFLPTKFTIGEKVYVLNYNSKLIGEENKYIYRTAALKDADKDKDGFVSVDDLEENDRKDYPNGVKAYPFSTEEERGIFLKEFMCKYPTLSFTEISPASQKVSCEEFKKTETPAEEDDGEYDQNYEDFLSEQQGDLTFWEQGSYTFASAIAHINLNFKDSDKYGKNQHTKAFIDTLAKTKDDNYGILLLTEKQYDDINGWLGFGQENMDFVKKNLQENWDDEISSDEKLEDIEKETGEEKVSEKTIIKTQGELILPHSDALKDKPLMGYDNTEFVLKEKTYVLKYKTALVKKDKFIYGDEELKDLDLDADGWINLTELEKSEKYKAETYTKGISTYDFSTKEEKGIFLEAFMCKYPTLNFDDLSIEPKKVSCEEFKKTETPAEEDEKLEGIELLEPDTEMSWTYESAIEYINTKTSLSDKYRKHKIFIDELYNQDEQLLTKDQYKEIKGWLGFGQENMEYVKDELIKNQGGTPDDSDAEISITSPTTPTIKKIAQGASEHLEDISTPQQRKMSVTSKATFNIKETKHTITIQKIDKDIVTITVESTPQSFDLEIGKSQEIIIDGEKVQITLNEISGGEVDISFISLGPVQKTPIADQILTSLTEEQTIASILEETPNAVLILNNGEEIPVKDAEKIGIEKKDIAGIKTTTNTPNTPTTCENDGGTCLDSTTYTCSTGFKPGKCIGKANEIQCCEKDGISAKKDITNKLKNVEPKTAVTPVSFERTNEKTGEKTSFTINDIKDVITSKTTQDQKAKDLLNSGEDPETQVLGPDGKLATLAALAAAGATVKEGSTLLKKDADIKKEIVSGATKKIYTGSTTGNFLANTLSLGEKASNAIGHSIDGVAWAFTVRAGIKQASTLFPEERQDAINALGDAAFWGAWAGKITWGLVKKEGYLGGLVKNAGVVSIGVGLLVTAIVFALNYEKEKTEIYSFTCEPWQAPAGGNKCEECNQQGLLPCTEYQCKSLGQSCELLNKGTEEEKCVWTNRNDVNPPEIRVNPNDLQEDYKYNPAALQFPNKEDRGVKIEYLLSEDKCVPAFTPLSFGIILDEPAKCKIDLFRKSTFEEMSFSMSNSLSRYNHTYILSLPNSESLEEGIIIENDEDFNLYIRCSDANGNFNIGNFVFNFCVDKGPDTTPPIIFGSIVGTSSFEEIVPIRYNQSSIEMEIYTNEPATCKWGHRDQNYESLEETMTCPQIGSVINLQMAYPCTTTLTGLKNMYENEFYFRCVDSSGNENRESYELTLLGTQPLVINHAAPNDTTISDSSETARIILETTTSAGYDDGDATCYYSDTAKEEDYVMFFYETGTSSYNHFQELWLTGNPNGLAYTYYIKCIDLGGNTDYANITFNVKTDLISPLIIRAYHEESYLKIITNEESDCVYDIVDCGYSFEDGISMTSVGEKSHFTSWDTNKNFYIKCRDKFGNLPSPDQCSITVKPSDF